MQNLTLSQDHQMWATTLKPTKKLTHALQSCDNTILIFSVNESSHFQGVARMESEPNINYKQELSQTFANLTQAVGSNQHTLNFQANFKVQWLVKCNYPFRDLEYLPGNTYNDNSPIYKSYNGQEVQFTLGNYFCHLLFSKGGLK